MVPLRETCKLFIGKISGQIDSCMSEFKVPQLEWMHLIQMVILKVNISVCIVNSYYRNAVFNKP